MESIVIDTLNNQPYLQQWIGWKIFSGFSLTLKVYQLIANNI